MAGAPCLAGHGRRAAMKSILTVLIAATQRIPNTTRCMATFGLLPVLARAMACSALAAWNVASAADLINLILQVLR